MTPYYDEDGITIYHGDCRDAPTELRGVDVIVTDPPYGINLNSGWGGVHGALSITGDDSISLRDEVLSQYEVPSLVFGSWKTPPPRGTRMVLVWDKGGHAGMGDLSIPWKPNWELVYVMGSGFTGRRDSGVLRHFIHPTFNANRTHPTEKPLSLMLALIDKCPSGVVFDPFMGSGTTLRAAKDLGRKAQDTQHPGQLRNPLPHPPRLFRRTHRARNATLGTRSNVEDDTNWDLPLSSNALSKSTWWTSTPPAPPSTPGTPRTPLVPLVLRTLQNLT